MRVDCLFAMMGNRKDTFNSFESAMPFGILPESANVSGRCITPPLADLAGCEHSDDETAK
jgi:hypothetical protein